MINDEIIKRGLAISIIQEMTIKELDKLFKFKKWDYRSEEARELQRDPFANEHSLSQYASLRGDDTILFEGEIFINDKE